MKEYVEKEKAVHAIEYRIAKLMKDPEFRKKHVDIDLYGAKQSIMNLPAADVVEVVRCKDCKHRPTKPEKYSDGFDIEFPEDEVCPCYCGDDPFYSWYPSDDWFCPLGERKGDTNDAAAE